MKTLKWVGVGVGALVGAFVLLVAVVAIRGETSGEFAAARATRTAIAAMETPALAVAAQPTAAAEVPTLAPTAPEPTAEPTEAPSVSVEPGSDAAAPVAAPATGPRPPQSMADLRALANRGQNRRILKRAMGSLPSCQSKNLSVLVPTGTDASQVAADLLKVAFAEGLDRQCNGGIVWGYKAESEVEAGNGYTYGRVVMNLGSNKRQTTFDFPGPLGGAGRSSWKVDY